MILTATPDSIERADRRAGAFLRRVEEGDVAEQRQIALVGDREAVCADRQLLVGDGDDAETVLVQFLGLRLRLGEMARVQGAQLVAELIVLADRENLLDRAFADQNMAAVLARQNDGQPPPHEVEGNFVDFLVLVTQMQVLADFGMLQHRDIEQVLQAGLVMAVEVGEFEHALAVVAVNVEVEFEDDAILRQRAGLVGAQDVHRAEILDGVQALDDHPLVRHRHRALGEVDGDDHRQHFRASGRPRPRPQTEAPRANRPW